MTPSCYLTNVGAPAEGMHSDHETCPLSTAESLHVLLSWGRESMAALSSWLLKLRGWAILVSQVTSLSHFLFLFSPFLSELPNDSVRSVFSFIPKRGFSFLIAFLSFKSLLFLRALLLPAAAVSLFSELCALGLVRHPISSPCSPCPLIFRDLRLLSCKFAFRRTQGHGQLCLWCFQRRFSLSSLLILFFFHPTLFQLLFLAS